uniref:Uncharacterized protein n=1 Tax=Mesocestoides corti TaxID=53468 RepID=A0A5K3FBF0_MESCO
MYWHQLRAERRKDIPLVAFRIHTSRNNGLHPKRSSLPYHWIADNDSSHQLGLAETTLHKTTAWRQKSMHSEYTQTV